MTREDLVRKKLGEIEGYLSELRTLGRPERIESDLVQRRFVEHTLQIAIQAALDVASHIVADERLGEARDNAELFDLLARHGWIDADRASTMRRVVGFRNVVVHGYSDVDLAVVRDVVERRTGDLLGFAREIRAELGRRGEEIEPKDPPA